ncbi:MAG: PepSY domain-containing protein [Candidatus Thiodiazotropha endolucinida]|uniref:Peptidase propeptide and YPEB domain protein n=1 Tax=Candidatus Thiodiazotropha endolucinida TaxID=1655433 RepID=A0A7Z0VMT6_9GAMM|nr:PepSY domain-containing protein [Candidatus Thiodiazotropha endolucinida]ODJ88577.1 peptidase propeptide and YPEB domain protein [Candidatus Thiodiazotropha endolucinida]
MIKTYRKPTHIVLPVALAFGVALVSSNSYGGMLEECLSAASQIKSGDFIKVEYLNPSAEGRPTYEIEVRTPKDQEWEFMCDASSGLIYEIEQEVDTADHSLFKKHAKISVKQASEAVLELYPGKIEEIEYEIEDNGDASYEIDVVDEAGTEFKVEVDAVSGKVIEVHVEKWEIGEESGERQ